MKTIKHQKTACFIAGMLASLGFAPVYAVFLFFAGIVFAWCLCDNSLSYKKASAIGYSFGFGFFGGGLYWI